MRLNRVLAVFLTIGLSDASAIARDLSSAPIGSCPGYAASNVQRTDSTLSAHLKLRGNACNTYGEDIVNLKLQVEYQTDSRLHVKIYDRNQQVYQVPDSVFPRPNATNGIASNSALAFSYVESPFSFKVTRKSNGEVLFDTSGSPLIFESQYLGLRTSLPPDPNIYGLGEHSDSFRLNTTDYTRTLWSRDSYGIPAGTNLYGNHPVYYDNRGLKGTHAVLLLSSNGMDIVINNTAATGQYLEYKTNGGIIDLYFMAGPGPIEAAQQYSEVAGKAAMQPYWGLGFNQCRYGYRDYIAIAEVIYNYSSAGIPLETMWTDIDYMDLRRIFTQDPERFPPEAVKGYVQYLREHDQHYIVMQDPGLAYLTSNYQPYTRAVNQDVLLRRPNGSLFEGVVWPGVTIWPDWFAPNTQDFWNTEFVGFYNNDTGFDIDALWIDMNEPSNFGCVYPCSDPYATAIKGDFPPAPPPVRTPPRVIPGFPAIFQPSFNGTFPNITNEGQPSGSPSVPTANPFAATLVTPTGLPGRDLINPPYQIHNEAGSLSNMTINTNVIHANGLAEYDTHNLYGTMMSTMSRDAMLARRPTLRAMVITRSTFAGAGTKVGHWLGDNFSTWDKYRNSIQGMLNFASLFQVPMVGSDVCGYAQNTTSSLCARWAMLGAFYPFYRNHNANDAISQEFYLWPIVTSAAQKAISIRYRLLDYFYTAMHTQTTTGTPLLSPLWFAYPSDAATFAIDLQFLFGPSILVSPVTEENATSVSIYLPNDQFYDLWTYAPVLGHGLHVTLSDIAFDYIPLHIKGGAILPLRNDSAMTTSAVRKQPFNILVAPALDGTAAGSLYIDDGVSLAQPHTTLLRMAYSNGMLSVSGEFGYTAEANFVGAVTVLGQAAAPKGVSVGGKVLGPGAWTYNATTQALAVSVSVPLTMGFNVTIT